MSFITKRERVFNEYDLLDLPGRNEGKLKAYASCTDARAWSHFCSDKSDHLVEIIKRNNEICRPKKYIPTDVIVNTLMGAKNAEINRLRRKIEEFEQLLVAYDHLDLTPDQKIEIANAHAAIKAANKELDDMCLDLDLSGYTEGIDSEAFQTGKSRGDERSLDRICDPKETKSNQTMGLSCPCDASTAAYDPRIDEMQEVIISKDAKLNAMRNTIAVMENDVCEPYCIYAHIYTALEKIFAVLCQNEKYKQYLDLLTSGKDTRNVDIKGKIFYKLKVLEKFCFALIAPCSKDCSCYHAEITSWMETTFALTSKETVITNLDSKRAELVADIMGNDEMKQILSKKNSSVKVEEISAEEDFVVNNNCSINVENLIRLKNLQASYEDLLTCYDELKYEKNCLIIKCQKYDELEKEYEKLRDQLNSYNSLWNEREYYKKRSEDLDILKEKYLVLADETLNLETQLKAQIEIADAKSVTMEQLRNENVNLEKRINEASIVCEKEKHALTCRLQEYECKIMCQDQQIQSLLVQINKFLERNNDDVLEGNELKMMGLINQIESQKEQINNLKDSLFHKEEEKKKLDEDFQQKLVIINNLRLEIEDWKRVCEKTIQRNDYLEKLIEETQDEMKKLIDENKSLTIDVEDKAIAIENLMKVVSNKSLEINKLAEEVESTKQQKGDLIKQLNEIHQSYNDKIHTLENERKIAMSSIKIATKVSETLLGKISDFDLINREQNVAASGQTTESNELSENIETIKAQNGIKQSSEDSAHSDEVNKFQTFNEKNTQNEIKQSSKNNSHSDEVNKLQTCNEKITQNEIKQSSKDNSHSDEVNKFLTFNEKKSQNEIKQSSKDNAHSDEVNKFQSFNEMHDETLIKKSSEYMKGLEIKENESEILRNKLQEISYLADKCNVLKDSYQQILEEKNCLLNELRDKSNKLEEAKHLIQVMNNEKRYFLEQIDENEKIKEEEKNCLVNELRDKLEEANHRIQVMNDEKRYFLEQMDENEKIKEDLIKIKYHNEILLETKNSFQNDLSLKNREIESLLAMLDKIKIENQRVHFISERIRILDQKIMLLDKSYDDLIQENKFVLNQINLQKDELNNLHCTLKVKSEENNNLSIQIQSLQEQLMQAHNKIDYLEKENLTITTELSAITTENDYLKKKINSYYEKLENELNLIKTSYNQLKSEKEKVQCDLQLQLTLKKEIELENKNLQNEINNLMNIRNEVHQQLASSSTLYLDLKEEVQKMKKEKDLNQIRIQSLLDDIDKSDQLIVNLREDISTRDVKISILENHVNELGDEVQRLQTILSTTIDFGEAINERNNKIDNSLKQMEAHHSKATHNMRIELAKLMDENYKLEEKISATKEEIEESTMKKDTYSSQVTRLEGEREIIVTYIKQLEIKCVGDSALSPDNCYVENILTSLDIISDYIEARNNSSQLVLSKADEAKRIVEKEKQNIIKEKEEIIKDKINVQKQLVVLKEQLEEQITKDKEIINDLEAELSNQKLIISKINESTENYVLKLEEELRSLRELYTNALAKISDLEYNLSIEKEQNKQNNNIIEQAKIDLEKKCQDIKTLQVSFETLKNKNLMDFAIQCNIKNIQNNISAQTENMGLREISVNSLEEKNNTTFDSVDSLENDKVMNLKTTGFENLKSDQKLNDLNLKKESEPINEVQILTANVKPDFDFVRNAYLSYKLKRLSIGGMEQYSVSCISDEDISDSYGRESLTVNSKLSSKSLATPTFTLKEPNIKINKISDIQTPYSTSSLNSNDTNQNRGNKTTVTGFTIVDSKTKDHFTNSIKNGKSRITSTHKKIPDDKKNNDQYQFTNSIKNSKRSLTSNNLEVSDYEDIFVIYQDTDHDNKSRNDSSILSNKEYLVKSKSLEINKMNSQTKDKKIEKVLVDSLPINYTKPMVSNNHERKKKSLNQPMQNSLSEVSLIKKMSHHYIKINNNEKKRENNDDKLNAVRLSRSLNSLISSEVDAESNQEVVNVNHNIGKLNAVLNKNEEYREVHWNKHHDVTRDSINKLSYDENTLNDIGKNISIIKTKQQETINKKNRPIKHKLKKIEHDYISNAAKQHIKLEDETFKTANDSKDTLTKSNFISNNSSASKNLIFPNSSSKSESSKNAITQIYNLEDETFKTANDSKDTFTKSNFVSNDPSASKNLIFPNSSSKSESSKNAITQIYNLEDETFKTANDSKDIFTKSNFVSNDPSASKKLIFPNSSSKSESSKNAITIKNKLETNDIGVMVEIEDVSYYNEKIRSLTNTLKNVEREYKEKIRAIKAQYDNNVKNIMNEHNQGVHNLQSLHEETLQDILKLHENETDTLRTLSTEAMRKVDKLEKENHILRDEILKSSLFNSDEEQQKISSPEIKKRMMKHKSPFDIKTLSKTSVEEFSIKPKVRTHGLCTCSVGMNVSDTIRKIFEQVDLDQRRTAEQAYLKYVANKILTESVEALDAQELSFLHFKVCRTWKTILRKQETVHKRIDSLETELMKKQRLAQKHIMELDRKVAEERRRLQEVRDALCRDTLAGTRASSPQPSTRIILQHNIAEKDVSRNCMEAVYNYGLEERLSAGDLTPRLSCSDLRCRRVTKESNRAVQAKVDAGERREKKSYCDERPTRLRRSVERPHSRIQKK
ncbi:unnamed protein product [Parnassius mnemosyne]|uniref:Uncharacterized protein n=1 Tax=Parnassius mnemosyne TaxID=213953 RepID=A0AAV1M8G6_9NEOP